MNNITKKIIICFLFFIFGCESIQTSEQKHPKQYTLFSNLPYVQLGNDPQYTFEINKYTQKLTTDEIDSPVIGLLLPEDKSKIKITVISKLGKRLFAPSIIFLDEHFQQIGEVSFQDFQYQRPLINQGNEMLKVLSFDGLDSQNYTYMLIYTAKKDITDVTFIVHHKRLEAELRGEELAINDVKVRHSVYGHIVLNVETILTSKGIVLTPHYEDLKPVKNYQHYDELKPIKNYFSEIKKLIENDDIDRALILRDEAKKRGIIGADKVFTETLQSKLK